MREKRDFAQRTRVLPSDQVRKKYFLVYEGEDTELIYFEAVNRYRDQIGIHPLIEMIPLVRSYSEKGWSNPKKILGRVLANLKEQAISYETLLNWIMDYFQEDRNIAANKFKLKDIWNILIWICKEKLHVELHDTVPDAKVACEMIAEHFATETGIDKMIENVSDIIKGRNITFAEGLDKICFVVDRDRESFVSHPENDQYGYVLQQCRNRGFGFYLTNPCFEFWLLLHFDDVMELNREHLLKNPKASAKRRYTEQELRKS